ncbi:MAG: 5-formyltetrahydrofolate cyclo-ligase [Candidatus Peregrinibacteria bacterium]|nr:5-formyltetrahydrofolate cyclo-ligase [Candidatus Peregrinibacteria bacterium]
MHVQEQKEQLRQSIRERLSKMNAKERAAESRTLCKELVKLLPKEPTTLCAYVPLGDEADIRPLLLALLKRGDALYLPRFEEGALAFRRANDLTSLKPGKFDIPEPPLTADPLPLDVLTHVLVPGRAFNAKGDRLGRGNGGYDFWIAKLQKTHPHVQVWGTALECQIVREIPMEEHDATVDAVVTARGRLGQSS